MRASPGTDTRAAARRVRDAAQPITGAGDDYAPLLDLIGDARVVLIGEASHGTHEFYRERARITQELITARGFTAVAVEADWPDAYRVNRFVRGTSGDASANQALADFQRFPRWMWRNVDVLEFVTWLRAFNDSLPSNAPGVGFYGLDLYSLHGSIDAVIRYLDGVDPDAALRARSRYSCFGHVEKDPQSYGYATARGGVESCEEQVIAQLLELQRQRAEYMAGDGRRAEEAFFSAEQNARLAKNAERYYRMMFRGGVSTWNLRDRHMAETLDLIVAHLSEGTAGRRNPAKVVVWEHNSHLGDARATEMGGARGELNVGQLVRERWGAAAVLIGQTTYDGTVTAARDWDRPGEHRRVRPGLPGSYEALFHETGVPDFMVALRDGGPAAEALSAERLERAIGVIYRPETERLSHYFYAALPAQFDAVLHFDRTRALEPLERGAAWHPGEPDEDLPETYPFAV